MSEGLVRIKQFTSFATITAIIIIILFYLTFVAMDLTRIFLIEKGYRKNYRNYNKKNNKKKENLKYRRFKVRFTI
jgi:hypothetical protein